MVFSQLFFKKWGGPESVNLANGGVMLKEAVKIKKSVPIAVSLGKTQRWAGNRMKIGDRKF